jgi:hypothetical protein
METKGRPGGESDGEPENAEGQIDSEMAMTAARNGVFFMKTSCEGWVDDGIMTVDALWIAQGSMFCTQDFIHR